MNTAIDFPDGKKRCSWCQATDDYRNYHDNEWGYPVVDDHRLFEKLCLEGFQSGLSWRTILDKRENFRKAFKQFDFVKVAKYTDKDVQRLLLDEGIVRHRGKIEATINNAKRAIELKKEFGSLAAYFWQYEGHQTSDGSLQASTEASAKMAKDLKKRGWKFFGPTTAYAFMQAMGLVNDHLEGCCIRVQAEQQRSEFVRPK